MAVEFQVLGRKYANQIFYVYGLYAMSFADCNCQFQWNIVDKKWGGPWSSLIL